MEIIAVVDDDADVRNTYSDIISLRYKPKALSGPFKTKDELVQATRKDAQGLMCDYQLTTHKFAPCSGAEVVSALYDLQFPAVLVTRFKQSDIDQIRPLRRKIAVILSPKDIDVDDVSRGLEQCRREFKSQFVASRKPWKTLLRVEDVDTLGSARFVKAVIPAWNPDEGIRFPIEMLPADLRGSVQSGTHLSAQVNIGAETANDLFLEAFEKVST